MKRKFLPTAARHGLSTILLGYSALAHCGDDTFAKWAATHAAAVTTVESSSNDSDLLPLESAMSTARVVALGEPMHGAHEPLAFRNRLFRFLVERQPLKQSLRPASRSSRNPCGRAARASSLVALTTSIAGLCTTSMWRVSWLGAFLSHHHRKQI